MAKRDVPTRKAFRQGELLFVPLDEADCQRLFRGRQDAASLGWQPLDTNVIREGEATGHKHEVVTRVAARALLFAPPEVLLLGLPGMDDLGAEDRLLISDGPVEIVHPEHQPLALPQGMHLIVVQREYDETHSARVRD